MGILNVDNIQPVGGGTTITLNSSEINVGTGVTFESNGQANFAGIVTATSFVGSGANLTGLTASFFEKTDVGINTISKVGIGTTNPTAKLEVKGSNNPLVKIVQDTSGIARLNLESATNDGYQYSGIGLGDGTNDAELMWTTGGFDINVGNAVRLRINSSGAWGAGTNFGSSGQVLTSQGSGSPVQWATPSSGLSDFDTWYLTADTVGNTNPIQNNWSRWTSRGGTGTVTFAAPSSGIWTFPSTGYWLIEWHARFQVTNAEERGCNADIYVTEDNTSYYFVNQSSVNMIQNSLAVKGNAIASYIFDVTDVSTHKMKVACGYQMVSGTLTGHGAYLYSHIKFFKLRDT